MESGANYQTVGRGLLVIAAAGVAFTQVARGLSTAATRTSAGIYVATLSQPCTPAGAVVKATIISGAAGGSIVCTPDGTGTVWTISTLNAAGAAADVNFSVSIEELAGS